MIVADSHRTAQQDAEHVRSLTKAEIQDFYQRKVRAGSEERAKLVVQLFARGGSVAETNGVAESEATVIEDVRAYKAGLAASAGARPARDVTEYEEIDAKL